MEAFPGAEIVGVRTLQEAQAPEGTTPDPEEADDED